MHMTALVFLSTQEPLTAAVVHIFLLASFKAVLFNYLDILWAVTACQMTRIPVDSFLDVEEDLEVKACRCWLATDVLRLELRHTHFRTIAKCISSISSKSHRGTYQYPGTPGKSMIQCGMCR